MRFKTRLVLGVVILGLGVSQIAWGVTERARKPSGRTKVESLPPVPSRTTLGAEALDKARDSLAGTDQPTVVAAAKALGESPASNAALPLVEMLAAGARPPGVIAAIDALRKLRDPISIDVLMLYAGNRNPDTRRHAITALGVFADARVIPILIERLGDGAPDVRGAAAEALANRAEKTSAPRLLALLKRNDAGAAAPLGATAPVSMLPEIAELQGRIDDANLAAVLGEILKRQDMPEPVRIDIIKTLARVPGAASTTALIEYVGTLQSADGRTSKIAAQKVVDERSKDK